MIVSRRIVLIRQRYRVLPTQVTNRKKCVNDWIPPMQLIRVTSVSRKVHDREGFSDRRAASCVSEGRVGLAERLK